MKKHLLPVYWIILGLLMLGIDYFSGPAIQFPIAFVFPILLAAWYSGRIWGIGLSVLLPLARAALYYFWDAPSEAFTVALNLVIRIIVLAGIAMLANYAAALTHEVKVLKGILPTCSGCKKIRTEDGSWMQMEAYIAEHSAAEFSHGLCDECAVKLYPDYFKKKT